MLLFPDNRENANGFYLNNILKNGTVVKTKLIYFYFFCSVL
ncbi:Hypothetical protein ACI5QL_03103 [Bacillus velezensis]|uniref:Uncharacterized protein n=1 Tax=Bacillus amyloliquefaciens (strain Y2) TaxID=1155777 RepID=I2C997_BACAY|nr:hypothetical protein MUS_3338 [Bacillus velezensis YAU B9601-Y2]RUS00605.1 hypothetical protein EFW58_01296 [Bacillus velezensis]